MDGDEDGEAIRRRRQRWIALALAAATSTAGLAGGAAAQDAGGRDAGGADAEAGLDAGAPLPCLSRERSGCG